MALNGASYKRDHSKCDHFGSIKSSIESIFKFFSCIINPCMYGLVGAINNFQDTIQASYDRATSLDRSLCNVDLENSLKSSPLWKIDLNATKIRPLRNGFSKIVIECPIKYVRLAWSHLNQLETPVSKKKSLRKSRTGSVDRLHLDTVLSDKIYYQVCDLWRSLARPHRKPDLFRNANYIVF